MNINSLKKYFSTLGFMFFLGAAVRVLLFPIVTSHYMPTFFIPFIDQSIQNPWANPWALSSVGQFPYGLISFLIFYTPKFIAYHLFGASALGTGIVSLALMKAPLLFFDLLTFKTLLYFLPDKKKQVYWLYWLNPVVIYLTFAYSHIDIISVALFLVALRFMLQKKVVLSACFFGMAVASKFYVFAIFPFMLIYIWNTCFSKEAAKLMGQFSTIVALFILVGFAPLFLAQSLGYVTIASPEALRLFDLNIFVDPHHFYFGVAIILMILFRLVLSTKITPNGLFLGSYYVFGVLIFVCFPLLNWYLWIFPGLVFFYANYKSFHRPVTLLFNCCLILQIATGFFSAEARLQSLMFTLTQTAFLLMWTAMWFVGLRREIPLRRRMNPFLIGIAGNSGSGKNHTSVSLSSLFGGKSTQIVEGDNYHRWQRGDSNWSRHTHLQPAANHLDRLLAHTEDLWLNKEISSKHYDHGVGQFTLPQITEPERLIIFQGLHTFYLNKMREQLDIKIFLNPDENICLFWKIQRDIVERKHSLEKVLETTNQRKLDSKKYVEPQKQFADWIIEHFPAKKYDEAMAVSSEKPIIAMRHILSNDYHHLDRISEIINKNHPGSAKVLELENDLTKVVFEIYDEPSPRTLHEIINYLDMPLRQITKSWLPPVWQRGYDGLTQILALMILERKGFNE